MLIVYNFVAKLELATCTFSFSYPTPSLPNQPHAVEIVFLIMVFLHLIMEVILFCSGQALIPTQPPMHHPILTVLVVFEVLRVTAHHAKFLHELAAGKLNSYTPA